jgi:hypothetical protein
MKYFFITMMFATTVMLSAHPDHGGGSSSGGSAEAAPAAESSGTADGQTSGASRATAGLFGTDVDSILDVNDFSSPLSGSFAKKSNWLFAFTRIGQNLFKGNLELGTAARISPTWYIAAYYNGWLKSGGDITKNDTFDFKKPDKEPETTNGTYQTGNPLSLALLLGIKKLGFKLSFEDSYQVDDSFSQPENDFSWSLATGRIKGSIDAGGFRFGPLDQIKFTTDFVFNEARSTFNNTAAGETTWMGGGAGHGTGADEVGWDFIQDSPDYDDDGPTYFEPSLYLDFDFGELGPGAFSFDNTLAMRFYGLTSDVKGIDGEKDGDVKGLSVWNTTQNTSMEAVWNDKFYLKDTVSPAYGIRGKLSIVEFAGNFALPMGFTFGSDNYSAKVVKNGMTAAAKNFYQSETFNFDLAPTLKAAVKVTPHKIIDLYAGLVLPLFSWAYSSVATKAVDRATAISGDDGIKTTVQDLIGGHYSAKGTVYTSKVTAFPRLLFSAGFTVNFAPALALDFVFLTVTKERVSVDTSVLLSVKL